MGSGGEFVVAVFLADQFDMVRPHLAEPFHDNGDTTATQGDTGAAGAQRVLGNADKVILDSDSGAVPYLPVNPNRSSQ